MKPVKYLIVILKAAMFANATVAARINAYDTDKLDYLLDEASMFFNVWFWLSSASIIYCCCIVIKLFLNNVDIVKLKITDMLFIGMIFLFFIYVTSQLLLPTSLPPIALN